MGGGSVRGREVAALHRALDSERAATLHAQRHAQQLQQALDSERSAVRALRREWAAQAKTIRDEEANKYAALTDQLRSRSELAQAEFAAAERESAIGKLTAQFSRELQARQDEWRADTRRRVDNLQEQLRQAQQALAEAASSHNSTDSLVHSLQTEFQRTLNKKQEQWKKDTKAQVSDLISQLKELQQLYTDTCNKLTTTTNEAEHLSMLRQEIKSLNIKNKELADRNQVLLEAEKRKVEEFRLLKEEYSGKLVKLDRTAKKETLLLLEELKIKERLYSGGRREQQQQQQQQPPPDTLTITQTKRRAQEKRKPPDPPRPKTAMLQKEGLDMLYQLLLEEHQELQKTHLSAVARLKEEAHNRKLLEEQLKQLRQQKDANTINAALAQQIQVLQERQADLESEAQELREQNDLLEFRILELDDTTYDTNFLKLPSGRSVDSRDRELDDISDSGVMSLPTSEDISESDFQDFKTDPNNKDMKSRLTHLGQNLDNISDRIIIQQCLSLLRHYEMRIESLENTLAVMGQEPIQTKPPATVDTSKSPSRVVATVLPFTELSTTSNIKDVKEDIQSKPMTIDKDCMQESGIFEESSLKNIVHHIGTQTDWTIDSPTGDLGTEIRKLTQIRVRIEEEGGNKRLLKSPEVDSGLLRNAAIKDLIFYRERVQMLEDKVAIYESSSDEQSKLLTRRLEKEVLLTAHVKQLQNSIITLKKQNQCLEEEKCEFEEAENDIRLRCQKLEVKLSALGEKKSDLQVQLQQNARTMSTLRSTLIEEERKRNEARKYAAKMEALVHRLEQQNFEMEEKEMEVRYRLHSLENIIPAMVMYYLWRILNTMRPFVKDNCKSLHIHNSKSDSILLNPIQCITDKPNSSIFKLPSNPLKNTYISMEEVGNFLSLNQKSEFIGPTGSYISTANSIIQDLSNRCNILVERNQALEMKEKVYQETLQKGDEILNKLETDYQNQLKLLEEELLQKQTELGIAESQLRKYTNNNELESQMQERLNYLEVELKKCHEILTKKDKEKRLLENENIILTINIKDTNDTIETQNGIIGKLREEELNYKNRIKVLLEDLNQKDKEKIECDEFHHKLVNELKKINTRACHELEEAEVTISELKEEVQTLEREVADLRLALCHANDSKERLLIQVGAELEAKDLQIRSLGCQSLAGSLHEELLELDDTSNDHQVDEQSTMGVPSFTVIPKPRKYEMDCGISGSLDENNIKCENDSSEVLRTKTSSLMATKNVLTDGLHQETMSSVLNLRMTVRILQSKCRVKDHMIRCLADQLRSCPWIVNDFFTHLSNDPPHTFDFNRMLLFDYINNILSPDISGIVEVVNDTGYSSSNPLTLKVVSQKDPLSLFVTWNRPTSNFIVGFELVVEGQMCERIYSAARTSTILHPVNLQRPVTLTISALQESGQIVQENSIRYPP